MCFMSCRRLRFIPRALAFPLIATFFVAACAGGKPDQPEDSSVVDIGIDGLVWPDTATDGGPPDAPSDGPRPDSPRPDGPTPDTLSPDTLSPDTLSPDTLSPDLPPPPDVGPTGPNVGAVCSDPTDCHAGTTCILSLGGTKICTEICTPDNGNTSANEDSCPNLAQNICGEVPLSDGTKEHYCLRKCQPQATGNTCPPPLACDPTSGSITHHANVAVCTMTACKTDTDCPVLTADACNAATGGGCSVGEMCLEITSGDRCARKGHCNTTSGLCEGHSQGKVGVKVGAPCMADVDCGNDQFCLVENYNQGDILWRGGYCTIIGCVYGKTVPKLACPTGSACNQVYIAANGLCEKSCSLTSASTCRGRSGDYLGDYECYAWNHYTIGGVQVATTPVCDSLIPCDFFSAGCDGLGLAPNTTQMSCRTKKNVSLASPTDPQGFCLDDTAAGPVK